MKAIRVHETGGPERLQLDDVPDPTPGAGELLIDVEAIGVNFLEIYQREGLYPLSRPFTLGSEAAGVVRALGANVAGFKPGDRVVSQSVKGAYAHLEFTIPARGLLGLRNRLMSATQGEAIMHHNFHDYQPARGDIPRRPNGVMVSMVRGQAVAYALDNLQQRGTMFVAPGDDVYEGMIIAENARNEDLNVNPTKEKKLTNMRAAGSDKNILLKPPRLLTLEIALEYIESDELVEITPSKIRLRKKELTEEGRKRAERSGGKKVSA